MGPPSKPPEPEPYIAAKVASHARHHETTALNAEIERQEIERQKIKIEEQKLDLERQKFELDRNVKLALTRFTADTDRWKARNEGQKTAREAIVKFAEIGIRSLLLLNGGAALSLLAFISQSGNSGSAKFAPADWASVFGFFALGSALSVACAGLAYVAQVVVVESSLRLPKFLARKRIEFSRAQFFDRIRYLAFGTAAASLVCFLIGLYLAYSAMSTTHQKVQINRVEKFVAAPWQTEHEAFWRDRPGATNLNR